jgi:hypothetical protein
MTRRTILAAALMVAVLSCAGTIARAHEGHGLTIGEVVAVAADSLQLKTAKQTLTIRLTATTKFEKNKKPVERTLLLKGDRVGVATTKSKSGELTATRVVLGLPAPKPATPAKPAK